MSPMSPMRTMARWMSTSLMAVAIAGCGGSQAEVKRDDEKPTSVKPDYVPCDPNQPDMPCTPDEPPEPPGVKPDDVPCDPNHPDMPCTPEETLPE